MYFVIVIFPFNLPPFNPLPQTMSTRLPSESVLHRWMSEPLKCLIIPTAVFLTNAKGFPVLPRSHQAFIQALVKLDCQFVIRGPNLTAKQDYSYVLYLQHLADSLGKPGKTEVW